MENTELDLNYDLHIIWPPETYSPVVWQRMTDWGALGCPSPDLARYAIRTVILSFFSLIYHR